jgi:hypothetical protein
MLYQSVTKCPVCIKREARRAKLERVTGLNADQGKVPGAST